MAANWILCPRHSTPTVPYYYRGPGCPRCATENCGSMAAAWYRLRLRQLGVPVCKWASCYEDADALLEMVRAAEADAATTKGGE